MDMQTKVLFITGKFPDSQVKQFLPIDEQIYPDFFLGEEFFVFKEHARASIQLISDDPDAYIEIETYDEDESDIIRSNDQEYIISHGGESDDMIVPGYYEINIHLSDRIYNGFYKVEPSTLSWEGLVKIQEFLENMLNGLTYNLYCRKMGKLAGYVSENPSLSEIYEHIVNNEQVLLNNIKFIVNNPVTNIVKKYREQHYSKIPDMKSQKWLSKKGITINSNPYVPEVNYEKHSTLDINTLENRWIKRILHYTINTIFELETVYSEIREQIKEQIRVKEAQYGKAQLKYENVQNQKYLASRYKYLLRRKVELLNEEIREYLDRKNFIEKILCNLKRIKAGLVHYKYGTWLARITDYEKVIKPSLKLFKEPHYFQIYKFYKKLISIERHWHGNKASFPFKKTSLLFEYYAVVVVIKILESLGYEWKRGWLADSIDPMTYNGEIPEGTVMTFIKGNLCLELAYNKEVKNDQEPLLKSQIININSTHTKPDMIITILDNNSGKLLNCMIIEVKCSKSHCIYNKYGDTKAIEQIKDYVNFGYYDALTGRSLLGGVKKVVLVYPKQNTRVNYSKFNSVFVQIDPADEINGYAELQEEIKEFLGEVESSSQKSV